MTASTTQRHMHLSPAAIVSAIQLFETTIPDELVARGEIMEAAGKPRYIRDFPNKIGGGGGSRTRVRRYFPEGIYMRIRFFNLAAGVRKRLKTASHQTQ